MVQALRTDEAQVIWWCCADGCDNHGDVGANNPQILMTWNRKVPGPGNNETAVAACIQDHPVPEWLAGRTHLEDCVMPPAELCTCGFTETAAELAAEEEV